ncbi:MAG: hypothetical protein LBP79_01880 [Clostridiales bacterium]|jgi:hypothetical protein|nr:hypothetical protein [Clostridiales bacterium]
MLNPNKNIITSILGTDKPLPKRPLLVTLRTDERLWDKFGDYAKENGTDRSKLLNEFIKKCTEKK